MDFDFQDSQWLILTFRRVGQRPHPALLSGETGLVR